MSSPQQFPTEIWSIDRIRPYEKNARKIPQVAIDKVARSLKEFGWQQPIVVEENGLIVVGHVRRLGALQERVDGGASLDRPRSDAGTDQSVPADG